MINPLVCISNTQRYVFPLLLLIKHLLRKLTALSQLSQVLSLHWLFILVVICRPLSFEELKLQLEQSALSVISLAEYFHNLSMNLNMRQKKLLRHIWCFPSFFLHCTSLFQPQ